MDELELESLVVRLMGDGSSYHAMLETAMAETDSATQKLEASGATATSVGGGLSRFATVAVTAFGTVSAAAGGAQVAFLGFAKSALGFLGVFGLAGGIQSAFDKFSNMENLLTRLRASIEANGRAAGPAMEEYKKYINTVIDTTLTTRSSTIAMLKQAEAYGFTGKKAENLVTTAIALAGSQGGEAQGYLRIAQLIERGNLQFARRILGLQGVKDESELATEVQKRLASGLKIAQAEAQTAGGKIQQLKAVFGTMSVEIGGFIASAILPLIDGLKTLHRAWNDLDAVTKRVITSLAAVAVVWTGWRPIIAMLTPLWSLLGAIAGFLTGPWIAAIAAGAAALYLIVSGMGGWEATWNALKGAALATWDWIIKKAGEFWTFVRPVWQAFSSLAVSVWGIIKEAALTFWDWLSGIAASVGNEIAMIWNYMFSSAVPAMTTVRDFLRDALLFIQFSIENFGRIWNMIWTMVAYDAVKFGNQIVYVIKDVIWPWIQWFGGAMKDLFNALIENARYVAERMIANMANIFKPENLKGLIKGKLSFKDLWAPLGEGLKVEVRALPKIAAREEGELEKSLREDFQRQGKELNQDWETFRAQKLKEFAAAGKLPDDVMKANGLALEQNIDEPIKEATKSMHKFDAALFGSAEALARFAEYKDMLSEDFGSKKGKGKHGGGGGGNKPVPRFDAADAGGAEGVARKDANTDLLKDIRDILKEGKDRGGNVDIDPADFA